MRAKKKKCDCSPQCLLDRVEELRKENENSGGNEKKTTV